jgi:hypothetical protein
MWLDAFDVGDGDNGHSGTVNVATYGVPSRLSFRKVTCRLARKLCG